MLILSYYINNKKEYGEIRMSKSDSSKTDKNCYFCHLLVGKHFLNEL
ncbi:conserved hypothetical protein [uncultured Dysgonomonas sp.]|uniref:Uncharacterized protein n=1 Tax=uncultured Dysgonomonas sp. TaxID=206096 RepID=A0A212JDJ7_9BACT|nr:conserved hypothetical protein [uncultured Dysgonomonas sp.]